jgi:oligopeptide transport system substrate-binding protein
VALLQRETEGNPFFLVQVVRALAEEVGQLDQIGMTALPDHVFAGGVQEVVQRRLNRVPVGARPLLQLAAVAGRELDLDLLRALAPEANLNEWLSVCADLAVLEVGGGRWRFAHHQLHQEALATLPEDVRPGYHRRVAEALERSSPRRVDERIGLLAHLWEQAQEPDKAIEYLLRAGDQARLAYAHEEAADYYRRALAFLREGQDHERTARTLMKLGSTYHIAFDFHRSRQAYDAGFAMWQRAGEIQKEDVTLPAPRALWVTWTDPATLDPANVRFPWAIVSQFFEGLVELTPELDVVPGVARTWEVREGGRTYIFHLRVDTRWSDGTPVTAQDFEYGWKRVLDPATESPVAAILYDVKGARAYHRGEAAEKDIGVCALDETTLAVALEGPTGYFLHLMAHPASYPLPRHVVEVHGKAWTKAGNIVTNGSFALETWKPGESLVLVRNDAYHGRFTGNAQRVELCLLPESSAQLELYGNGDLDVLWVGRLSLADRVRARLSYTEDFFSAPLLHTGYVGFDVSRPPFDDPRVRRAFALAIDKEFLASVVLQGISFPATGGFVPPGMPGNLPGIGLPYDPDQAQRLLSEAGYPDGVGFPAIRALASWEDAPTGDYLQAQWREKLGIEIKWENLAPGAFFDKMKNGPPPIFLSYWVADYPDPDNFMRLGLGQHSTGWRNWAYDSLIETARRVTDQGERIKMYQKADSILVEETPIIPLTHWRLKMLVKPWVRKYPTSVVKWWFWKDVIIGPH